MDKTPHLPWVVTSALPVVSKRWRMRHVKETVRFPPEKWRSCRDATAARREGSAGMDPPGWIRSLELLTGQLSFTVTGYRFDFDLCPKSKEDYWKGRHFALFFLPFFLSLTKFYMEEGDRCALRGGGGGGGWFGGGVDK